jgi:glyoxylase-like metal-dependent hydrolase (beta-lactamase superfamily II)
VLPTGDPMMWSPLASTMVFGETDAVLVDPPFTREHTARVGDWIEASGKRLTHIYITHGHGDHWFGAPLLVERFPGTTVYATEGTIALMHQEATQGRAERWDTLFPEQIGETPVIARAVPVDGFILEGHRLEAIEVGHSDCDGSTVLHVPSIGLVVAGDVAYNGVHQYLAEGGDGGLDVWIRAVDKVRALRPRAVVAGHKNRARADDPRILEETTEYLRTAQRLLAEKPSAAAFIDAMWNSYPDRLNPATVLSLSATGLLGQ